METEAQATFDRGCMYGMEKIMSNIHNLRSPLLQKIIVGEELTEQEFVQLHTYEDIISEIEIEKLKSSK